MYPNYIVLEKSIHLVIDETTFPSFSCRLFEEHAELLGLFEKFKELKTKEQQATSEDLAEHANKVMETLDEGIRSLDELDVFFQYLHEGKYLAVSFSSY